MAAHGHKVFKGKSVLAECLPHQKLPRSSASRRASSMWQYSLSHKLRNQVVCGCGVLFHFGHMFMRILRLLDQARCKEPRTHHSSCCCAHFRACFTLPPVCVSPWLSCRTEDKVVTGAVVRVRKEWQRVGKIAPWFESVGQKVFRIPDATILRGTHPQREAHTAGYIKRAREGGTKWGRESPFSGGV